MKLSNNNGFTLIELMIVVAIASILLAAVVSAYQVQVRSKNTQELLTDMNQTARAALEIMVHELRQAGCDPDGVAGAGIVNAGANDITFAMDIGNTAGDSFQPDGLLDGPNEQIRYTINAAGNLGRDNFQGNGLQPLARNVDALNFVYLDQFGNVTAVPADIRTIQITLVVRSQVAGGFTQTHTDNVAYTNQQGDEILAAQNDSFRRFMLTTTVACRNIGLF